jgi:hypothetical protein
MTRRKKPSPTPARNGPSVTSLPDAGRYEEDVVVVEPVDPDAGAGDEAGVVVVVAAGAVDSFFSSVFFDVVSPPPVDGGLSLSE